VTSHVAPVAQDGPDRPQSPGQAAAGPPTPGRPPSAAERRPPGRPAGSVIRLGAGMVAEPLPTGAWLRPAGTSPAVDIYRGLLSRNLAGGSDLFRIVIGYPDAPAVPIHQILELCGLITATPADSTRFARFARFGPVSGPAPTPVRNLGQALADLMDHPVVVTTGIRLLYPAAQGGVETRALLPEGAMTWLPYATDFGYQPRRSAAGTAVAPIPLDAAAPIPGLAQTRPGAFALGGGKVLEVVQSGLWLRTDPEPANSAMVRGLPPSPSQPNLIYETHTWAGSERARRTARKVVRRLDERFRTTVRILPANRIDRLYRQLEGQADSHSILATSDAFDTSAPAVGRSRTVAAGPAKSADIHAEASAALPGEVRREAPAPDGAVPDHAGTAVPLPNISAPDIAAPGVGQAPASGTAWFLRESAPPAPPATGPDQGSAAAHSTTPSKDWNPR